MKNWQIVIICVLILLAIVLVVSCSVYYKQAQAPAATQAQAPSAQAPTSPASTSSSSSTPAANSAATNSATTATVPSATPATNSATASTSSATNAAQSNFFSSAWLEVPASPSVSDTSVHYITHRGEMGGTQQRNYSYCYDSDTYASSWVAYPLCASHLSTGREESWSYDSEIPASMQTSVTSGYGASVPTENYPKNFYARGHQIPNADRNGVPEMMAQTYYSTNMTPQIQNGFNGGIWAKLESAVRDAVPASDTLYIVTGAYFTPKEDAVQTRTIVNKNDKKTLPVPDYYWKAVLKVKRDAAGQPVSAVSVGFWLPHKDLKNHVYTEYVVPVDSIEAYTGLDLFTNLPDTIEAAAEAAASWSVFLEF